MNNNARLRLGIAAIIDDGANVMLNAAIPNPAREK
jgi:hypothetical protein